MLTAQQQTVCDILADGRWHGIEDFLDAHIPDYRKRLSELGEQYPGRFVSRYRFRPAKGRSEGYRAKDWQDTRALDDLRNHVTVQVNAMRRNDNDGRAEEFAGIVRLPSGIALKSVTHGQLRYFATDELVERCIERYVDPWA